jgi:hypothetical protein
MFPASVDVLERFLNNARLVHPFYFVWNAVISFVRLATKSFSSWFSRIEGEPSVAINNPFTIGFKDESLELFHHAKPIVRPRPLLVLLLCGVGEHQYHEEQEIELAHGTFFYREKYCLLKFI